ncbi:TPA: DNA lesion error-prone repair protein ImuA, partial [Stenotrophomonas maltophilia]|nr:DNA lesion error-prone repair protein ImuA [Stenotrophomonas maltophilia]
MGAVVALDRLLDGRQLWRGPARQGPASDHLASGHPALDARLPGGGWPAS